MLQIGVTMGMTKQIEERATATVGDPRWAAVIARDPSTDGQFFYSVKTTGVYCRPSCAARRARPESVQFHLTGTDAEHAGFRPCERCRPHQPPLAERHAALVAEMCRFIENAEQTPALKELAEYAGLSANYVHRIFKGVAGVTPKAYGAARLARPRRAGAQPDGHRGDLRRRLQLGRPLLRDIERGLGNDAD